MGASQSHAGIELLQPSDVEQALIMNGFEVEAPIFAEHGIDGKTLLTITPVALRAMNLQAGHELDERTLNRMFDTRARLLKHERTVTREQIIKWTPEQVAAMLRLNHLGRYATPVLRDEINGGLLMQLKESIGKSGDLMQDEMDILRLQSVLTYYVTTS